MSPTRQERRQIERQEAKARRKSGVSLSEPHRPAASAIRWKIPIGVMLVCLIVIGALAWKARHSVDGQNAASTASYSNVLPQIADMVKMSDDELGRLGVTKVNLACATGLGTKPMTDADAEECFKNLDRMTQAVRLHTANNYYKFAKNPAEYENSDIYYKVAMLITVVEQDFGVRYNPAKTTMLPKPGEQDLFFDDPADVFVLGALGVKREGTCSSMPVACVAVGRELGYPLKLVSAKGHLFFRWDDGAQKMNFECTHRVNVMSDEEFKKWPHQITDDEIAKGFFLKNLSPREELAVFLSIRGNVLNYFGQYDAAVNAVKQAYDIDPHPAYVAAGRTFWKRRADMSNLTQSNSSGLLYEPEDDEVMFQRMMLPFYQKQGLNFVPGVIPFPPLPQQPRLPDPSTLPQ